MTILKECFNSLIRNVVNNGFTVEFRNKNTTEDSLSTISHFFPRQPEQFASTRIDAKYGIREMIRKSRIKKEVVTNFHSLLTRVIVRMSVRWAFVELASRLWKSIRARFRKKKNIPKWDKLVVISGNIVCKCISMEIYTSIGIPASWRQANIAEKITMIELHKTSVFGLTVFR